jgi:hypothetical protein
MEKPALGIAVGAVLGALDGLSAWFSPEARPMMLTIVLASTAKGMLVGYIVGLIARKRRSVTLGITAGIGAGFVLSSVAAIGQGDHYWEIVLPGMLVGAFAGFLTQRQPHGNPTQPLLLFAGFVSVAAVAAAGVQQSNPSDAFDSLSPLIGTWKGTSEGQPGVGSVTRTYERLLGGRFIRVRNRSEYPPQTKNPKGEAHEDEGFFSFDRSRKRLVFRQFHIEGFVNTYVSEPNAAPKQLVFVTEAIENIPAGWRARETYIFHGPDAFEEVFELAEVGKEFALYSRARFERVK